MKNNKKGFTLIELLTVIAILAVILLIAAPTILGVLDKAKKNTFKNQVLLYVESMKTQMALRSMGSDDLPENSLTYDETAKTYSIVVTNVPMDTQTLTGGTIVITEQTNGEYTFGVTGVHNNDYTVTKTNVREITVDDVQKYTAPADDAA